MWKLFTICTLIESDTGVHLGVSSDRRLPIKNHAESQAIKSEKRLKVLKRKVEEHFKTYQTYIPPILTYGQEVLPRKHCVRFSTMIMNKSKLFLKFQFFKYALTRKYLSPNFLSSCFFEYCCVNKLQARAASLKYKNELFLAFYFPKTMTQMDNKNY